MSLTVSEGIPAVITAGDGISFRISDSLYPAGTWTSSIIFRGLTGAVVSFAGVQSGTSHLFTLSNSDTATLFSGRNTAVISYSDGTYRQTGATAQVVVRANPSAGTPESFARKQVALLRQVIETFNSTTNKEANFSGQSFVKHDIDKYQMQLAEWERRVADEDQQALVDSGVAVSRRIPVAFR